MMCAQLHHLFIVLPLSTIFNDRCQMSIASYIKVNQFSRKGVRTAPVGATQEEHLNLQCPPLVMVCLFQLCFPPVFIRRGCWKEICKGCIPSFVLHTTIKQI